MRQARKLADEREDYGYYHCIARVVNQQFLFGDEKKEHLVRLMKGYAALFCGVE
jgi:hypothetical protein